jgi:hypothetical protein
MLSDAIYSIYIIISFLSLASISVAFLLTNNNLTKVLASSVFYAGALIILYYTYPGSTVIPLTDFLGLGVASISGALFLATYVPRYMKGREKRGMVPLRNILVPIFSISKRSIRRRQLRFLLTLTSTSLLILSFVSLTSVSEGFGVVTTRVANPTGSDGILLRANEYDEIDLVSLSPRDISSDWLEQQVETKTVSAKVENKPQAFQLGYVHGAPVWGFLGISVETEDEITGINTTLLKGSLPSEDGVVLSQKLSTTLDVDVGGQITFHGLSFRVEGIFVDEGISSLKEYDGTDYLPGKLVDLFPEDRAVFYVKQPCLPSEVLFFNIDTALNVFKGEISRISIVVNEGYDENTYAERLALERGFLAFSSTLDGVYTMRLAKYFEGKGVQLLIPWGIVILNVVVTMLNSMFERKKEIQILSSLGLNPSQIATIFIAEASIIGLTSGGIGYLAGMSLYKVLPLLGVNLGVQQKVSAAWSLASVSISVVSVLAGAFAALQGSVVITPSLTRKWRIDSQEGGYITPWEVTLPVKLVTEEVDPFIDYMVSKLGELENGPDISTSYIRVPFRTEDKVTVTFAHRGPSNTAGSFYTKNSIIVDKTAVDITVKLQSYGERAWVHQTGSLVRMIAMRWSTSSERIDNHVI